MSKAKTEAWKFINEKKIVEFFRQPRGFRKPTKEERAGVVATHGVYALYSDLLLVKQAKPNVPVNGLWRIDDFLLLSIGIVTQRPIKKRLYYAFGRGRADQHEVPMGLGCLLSNTLGIELRRGKQPKFFVFVPREPLQNWIADHVCFKYLETKEPKALERMLITELRPLLNLGYNEQHPFYTVIQNTINSHKSHAKTLPRIEESSPSHTRKIECLALDTVTTKLKNKGWHPKKCKQCQEGYDIEAVKNYKHIKIEMKSRGIYGCSGPNASERQKEYPRRFFNFSPSQVETADYFICVFIGPKIRECIIVPKKDFTRLETSKGRLVFIYGKNCVKRNKIDITKYIEGWDLLEKCGSKHKGIK